MDKVFEYKGYQGSINASIEDDCLHGKVLHITDVISYGAEKPSELQKEFERVVDIYLAKCKIKGKEPNKPFSGSFNVRLTPQLHQQAVYAAKKQAVSLNSFVNEAIANHVVKL